MLKPENTQASTATLNKTGGPVDTRSDCATENTFKSTQKEAERVGRKRTRKTCIWSKLAYDRPMVRNHQAFPGVEGMTTAPMMSKANGAT